MYGKAMWIGGKMDITGAFGWSDGSYTTFTNWVSGGALALPHCIQPMYDGQWRKTGCDGNYGFIC